MKKKVSIRSYIGHEFKKHSLITEGHDLFLSVEDKEYRLSIDPRDNNLVLTLINGHEVKVCTENGYPAVKLIGRSR